MPVRGKPIEKETMRGVGGSLLCIGDLLSDVTDDAAGDGAGGEGSHKEGSPPSSPSSSIPSDHFDPCHLHQLFQENYDQLVEALKGNDHSWTALTLKLCSALRTADKLVSSANSSGQLLLEKVGELESIIKCGNSAVEAAKAFQSLQTNEVDPSIGSLIGKHSA